MADLSPASLKTLQCAGEIIRKSRRGVVLTGAGISTPSGIPDFRSTDSGLWQKFDPFEVASLSAFRYHPEKFYNWIRPLARQIYEAEPNPAHLAISRLERTGHVRSVITQNIDGLHQRAGSNLVFEIHGSMETLTCVSCYRKFDGRKHHEAYFYQGVIPHCTDCGHILKPDVVLFGEQLPVRAWLQAQQEVRDCDLMIVAGSSLEVLPVAGLPLLALDHGAHLILINKSKTYIDVRADMVFEDDVIDILPRLVQEALR